MGRQTGADGTTGTDDALRAEIARLEAELARSGERRAATSQVLSMIAAASGEVGPVFDAILENAMRLCEAEMGYVYRVSGDTAAHAASHGGPAGYDKMIEERGAWQPDVRTGVGWVIRHKAPLEYADLREHPLYAEGNAMVVAMVEKYGMRTLLHVPMMRGNEVAGVIVLYRCEVRPFDDHQVDLVTDFATQAVIAIENARLLDELNTRNRDLAETLEQQTATSEILRAIASAPGAAEGVLDTIAETAVRRFGASSVGIRRIEGNVLRAVGSAGMEAVYPELPLDKSSFASQAVLEARQIHLADTAGEEVRQLRNEEHISGGFGTAQTLNNRTVAFTPLVREGRAIGVMRVNRAELRPFSENELQLMTGFADQAVIAIENARLLDELNTRNRDLAETLEQQTATSEILRTIASSPAEAERALDKIAEVAARMFDGRGVNIRRVDGDRLRVIGSAGAVTKEVGAELPDIPLDDSSLIGAAVSQRRLIHMKDPAQPDPADGFIPMASGRLEQMFRRAGRHSAAAVPLMREAEAIGGMVVVRTEVRPFTASELALLETFADQAVIAIENARLLDDLRESLDRQTAMSDVLATISASPGDVQPVFEAMMEKAVDLCGATNGGVFMASGEVLRQVASRWETGKEPDMVGELPFGPGTALGRMRGNLKSVYVPDLQVKLDTKAGASADDPIVAAAQAVAGQGVQSILWVPMVRDGEVIGAFVFNHVEPHAFTKAQISLVETFADQAVIAIENARLLDDLRESLDRQTASAEILRTIAASPAQAENALDTIARTTARLFGASGATIRTVHGDKLRRVGSAGPAAVHLRAALGEEYPITPDTMPGFTVLNKRGVHIPDVHDPDSEFAHWPGLAPQRLAGTRTMASAPLMREDEAIGAIMVQRGEFKPFTDTELAQLANFADQAVIAIENARLLDELQARNRDLSEALEQQTATAEVLRAIASSPGDAEGVLQKIVETTARLFGVAGVVLRLRDGDILRAVASSGASGDSIRERVPEVPLVETTLPGFAVLHGRQIHIADAENPGPEMKDDQGFPIIRGLGERSAVATPLTRQGEAIGAMMVARDELKPFTESELAQLANFADQAVIAIENARLLSELRESLDRQTATAEVLHAIASAPGEADQALQKIVDTTARLFGATGINLRLRDGEVLRSVASTGTGDRVRKDLPELPLDETTLPGAAILLGRQIHIADTEDPGGGMKDDPGFPIVRGTGVRSATATPLKRQGEAIGAIMVGRDELRPFTESELAQLANFADQAVIAIENARLLSELRESLERRTATAEVLAVISSSPGDVQPVFDAMLKRAVEICDADNGSVFTVSGDEMRRVANRGVMPTGYERIPFTPGTMPERMRRTLKSVHVPDLRAHVANLSAQGNDSPAAAAARTATERGIRCIVWVPMVRDGELVGAFALNRPEPRPFTDAQIGLVETFASQAVIAIENARLLEELRESLENQTASAEILRTIAADPAEAGKALDTIARTTARLFDANAINIRILQDGLLHNAASMGETPRRVHADNRSEPPDPRRVSGAAIIEKRQIHIPDVHDADVQAQFPYLALSVEDDGSLAATPLLRRDEAIGVIVATRVRARPFTESELAQFSNFASQAVIAIENARLLEELRSARDAAERALDDLKTAQASLIQAEKMASLGQLTAGIAHEIKNPLNFVNNFAGLSVELLGELKETAGPAFAALGADDRADVDEVVEMLTGNLEKVAEHGKRADNIVKSMLAHSRSGGGERQSVDINALVEEALNLAYHGARAQDPGFNITMARDLDPGLPPVEAVPQDLIRVFLNLFGNGFYAANKRAREGGEAEFHPTLSVSTHDRGADVEIRIRDNGTGIPAELRPRLFEPFFTTKPTGEGTGLGLSISYEIVTQMHGGTITIDSEPGEFTEFCITIPKQG